MHKDINDSQFYKNYFMNTKKAAKSGKFYKG